MRPIQIVDANLREAMRFFGRATGKGEVCTLGNAQAIFSGLNYGVFNIGMLTGGTLTGDSLNGTPQGESWTADLDAALEQCSKFYARHGTRWSFWLCEERLESAKRRAVDNAFAKHGMRRISNAPGMLAETLRPPSRKLPAIECVPVSDAASRLDFGGITAASFDIPMSVVSEVYHPERGWQGSYRGYVGRAGGRPVAIIAIVATSEALGVYSLATMPEVRRRGFGEALLRAALDCERARTGIERVILQSTEAGHTLYQRLGFREVGNFSVYLTR